MNDPDRIPKIIARGKARFIFTRGVLGWGLLTASLFVGWTLLAKKSISPREVVLAYTMFPLGGIFWGTCMWARIKRSFDNREGGKKA
jgi:hypothetical protein